MLRRDRKTRGPWKAAVFLLLFAGVRPAAAQVPANEEDQLQILTDPASLKKKVEKEKVRAPFEFFRSQVAPFDVLPYVKANHWSNLWFEMRANEDDYDGYLKTDPVLLLGTPQEITYRRKARMIKEQRARLSLVVMVPSATGTVPKETGVDLVRLAHSADATWPAMMTTLPPHQMLLVILSKDSTSKFAAWHKLNAVIPTSVEREGGDIEKLRYYRLVLPMEPDKVALSPHPLTWSTISHVIWDNFPPDLLSGSVQRALIDWLHWGGQLVVTGGAGQSYTILRESFLGAYLPADASGETVPLKGDDLQPLAQAYAPPVSSPSINDQSEPRPLSSREARQRFARRYEAPAPIRPAANRPLYLSVLRPKAGASTIALGEASPRLLAAERQVGRGRITMLAINPNEESILAWPGLDTLVRRVILRRPEEPIVGGPGSDGFVQLPPDRGRLLASDLSRPAKAAAPARSAKGPLAPERVAAILKALDEAYPDAVCALNHRSPWELLVATILSAQCTDVRVNMVTPELFRRFPTPARWPRRRCPSSRT